MNKQYTFIIANGEGKVGTKNGVFHLGQLRRILNLSTGHFKRI